MGLATAFYFRATETSNRFYDNSFKFTKDISENLGRIEERFGERLKHIDESYSGLSKRLSSAEYVAIDAAAEVEDEKVELKTLVSAREAVIEELATRASLSDAEKAEFKSRLESAERELDVARDQLKMVALKYEQAKARELELREKLGDSSHHSRNHPFHRWFLDWITHQIPLSHIQRMPIVEIMDFLEERYRELKTEGSQQYQDGIELSYFSEEDGWLPPAQDIFAMVRRDARSQQIHGAKAG